MDILKNLKTELECERDLAEHFRSLVGNADKYMLYCKTSNSRSNQFFCRRHGEKNIRYIKRNDSDQIVRLIKEAFNDKALQILEHDMELITNMIDTFMPYDSESIMDSLPVAYQKAARDHMDIPYGETVESNTLGNQPRGSENSITTEKRYMVSNGLVVRSKSEALIAEYLLAAGIPFDYERGLDLYTVVVDEAGFEYGKTVRVYPDFTIYLPDGSIMIWEHEGMMDTEQYKKRNIRKIMLYYRNGYYMPHNLIMTMEGDTRQLDIDAIKRIVDGFIKPLFK